MKKFAYAIMLLLSVVAAADSRLKQDDEEKYYQMKEVDQKITITSKPRPPGGSKNCAGESGRVSLRVFFHKSEKISRAEIARPSACADFDREAVSAAKQIKFKAAMKNGRAVSVVTIVEYNWQKY